MVHTFLPRVLQPLEIATARYIRSTGYIIQGGPFRGLRYIRRAFCSALAPKLAGTYERELSSSIAEMLACNPDLFVDIGAAEGYYAVGAAFSNWSPRIVAYESNADARAALRELGSLNNVPSDRIELRGLCTPGDLDQLLASANRPAIIMDVEGFEALLLDPLRLPQLVRTHILVEHHDFLLHGLCAEICCRMEATHSCTTIEQQERSADELVCNDTVVRLMPAAVRRRVLRENRPFWNHGWLWFTPRQRSA